jgi:ABC-type multidrug transport system ATPase subunit
MGRYIGPFLYRAEDITMEIFSVLTKAERNSVVEALRMFSDDIEGAEILTPTPKQPRFYIQSKRLGSVPISSYGTGMRRVLSLAMGVLISKDGVLLIDEIETAIHHSALQEVFPWLLKLANANNTQIFATTHSLETINALLEASNDGELVAYHLKRRDEALAVTRYDWKELSFLCQERGLDIR